jgi:hypothetical protein
MRFSYRSGYGKSVLASATPTQILIPASQFNLGWGGEKDVITSGTKVNLYSGATARPNSVWAGIISSTDAFVSGLFQNTSTTPTGMVKVSVDGGAFIDCPVSAGEYTLFTGLSQAEHSVVIAFSTAYSTSVNSSKTGNSLRVIGINPSVQVYGSWRQIHDNATDVIYGNTLVSATLGANYQPANLPSPATTPATSHDRLHTMQVRGDYTTLSIITSTRYVYVSVDGNSPVRYDAGTILPTNLRISGLSGIHTYNVWSNASSLLSANLSVGGTLSTGLVTIGTRKRLIQLGDSITEAAPSAGTPTSRGESDIMGVASALGYVGVNCGLAGDTITAGRARYAPTIATLPSGPTANDVLVIALGRNNLVFLANTDYDLNAAGQTDYPLLISDAIAHGWKNILCRGVLHEATIIPVSANARIQGYVNASGDARVKYVNVSSWSGISTYDGVHPNNAGYASLRGYAAPSYSSLIV